MNGLELAVSASPAGFIALQMIKLVIYFSLMVIDSKLLGLPFDYTALAILGSLSGGICIGYFERYRGAIQFLTRTTISSISGLFLGGFCVDYFEIEKLSYTGFAFFLSSLLSVIILRAIVDFTKGNASTAIKEAFRRFFNIDPDTKGKKHDRE